MFTRLVMLMLIFMVQIALLLSNSLFMIWLCLELNMFFILSLLYQSSQSYSFHLYNYRNLLVVLWYFMIQVVGSFLILIKFFMSINSYLLLIGFLLKLGFFPFFYWVVYLYSSMQWMDVFMIGYLSKMGLFFIMPNCFSSLDNPANLVFLSFLITYIVSLMGMYMKMKSLKVLAGWSSLNKMSLLFLFSLFDLKMSFSMFMVYGLVFFFFCIFMSFMNEDKLLSFMNRYSFTNKNFEYTYFFMMFLWFVGLPPFSMFWMKMIFLFYFTDFVDLWFISFMGLMMFLQVLVYMKMFNLGVIHLKFLMSQQPQMNILFLMFILLVKSFFIII